MLTITKYAGPALFAVSASFSETEGVLQPPQFFQHGTFSVATPDSRAGPTVVTLHMDKVRYTYNISTW